MDNGIMNKPVKKKERRFPIGAEVLEEGVHFRVWAPKCQEVEIVLNEKDALKMEKEPLGYFSLLTPLAYAGTLYKFRLDGKEEFPDPVSRYQPEGPHGPSCVVDAMHYLWHDKEWQGISSLKGHCLYELHVGSFTPEGTFKAARDKLKDLADLGITIIELMPLADFAGEFGWGYDGVNMFAPTRLYGTPDDVRDFINQAHLLGMGVILDVVYNHFGPDGNYISFFSEDYFNDNYKTDWGKAINYEGKNGFHVREFYLSNALYWLSEFHFDGLRLDATQDIHDNSEKNILAELTEFILKNHTDRPTIIIGENEPQDVRLLQSHEKGGFGLDGVWNDDFHHSAIVAITGRNEAYYTDYMGTPQEFISSVKYGYLYQGQYYKWQNQNRGTPSLEQPYHQYVIYLQNHDQIANSTRGFRIHEIGSRNLFRAITTLMILSPQTPLLFQGQEFGASSPFHFFAHHTGDLGRAVWEGRKHFLSQFASFNIPDMHPYYPDPCIKETFLKCKLNWDEKLRDDHQAIYLFHKALLKLRKEDPIFINPLKIDGAVITPSIFLLRYFGENCEDRLIVFNFGIDQVLHSVADPLFAPPEEKKWKLLFSSESPQYGGLGIPIIEQEPWKIAGYSANVFKPVK